MNSKYLIFFVIIWVVNILPTSCQTEMEPCKINLTNYHNIMLKSWSFYSDSLKFSTPARWEEVRTLKAANYHSVEFDPKPECGNNKCEVSLTIYNQSFISADTIIRKLKMASHSKLIGLCNYNGSGVIATTKKTIKNNLNYLCAILILDFDQYTVLINVSALKSNNNFNSLFKSLSAIKSIEFNGIVVKIF